MNIVNPINTSHELKIIPRGSTILAPTFELINEQTKEVFNPTFTFSLLNGYLFFNFDFDFVENQKFQIKITENNKVAYRGKLFVTSQNTQTFKASNELYFYE